jgi:hypothetical protein
MVSSHIRSGCRQRHVAITECTSTNASTAARIPLVLTFVILAGAATTLAFSPGLAIAQAFNMPRARMSLVADPPAVSGATGSVENPTPKTEAADRRARRALDAILACERPAGGWTYVCARGVRTWGATAIVNAAERIAGPLGLATWDLVVMRSPGTPAAGLLLVRGFQDTGDGRYLAAARRTGDLLLNTQLATGGWFSEMPVHGDRLARWFRLLDCWTTLDDDVTPGATRFLLALWAATGDDRYRGGAERALALLVRAQLPGGGWPLTWRSRWLRYLSPSFEDLASMNDAATPGAVLALLDGARLLDRDDLIAAARRAGDWMMRTRARPPHAGWAQQYDHDDRPTSARRFEVGGLAAWETRAAVEALLALADATDDSRYCDSIPDAVRWLAGTTIAPHCWARFYDAITGRPFFVTSEGLRTDSLAAARGGYAWTGDFGIPRLLAEAAAAAAGAISGKNAARPPRRLPGDSGVCPGERPSERKIGSPLSRARIAGAGVLVDAARPAPNPRVCASALAAAIRDGRDPTAPP